MAEFIAIVVLFIGISLVVAFLSAYPVMLLWNALLPGLFGFPVIGFWQALGLCVMCNILFKSNSTSNSKK